MKLIKVIGALAGMALTLSLSAPTYADVIYSVTSTTKLNCGTNPGEHGLWTNNSIGGGACSNYFDIDTGSTLTFYNSAVNPNSWTAVLAATATNPYNVSANIALTFSNYSDNHTLFDVKNGGGASAAQIADWIFFRDAAGTITINNTAYYINDLAGNTGLQIGIGANDKTIAFGASAWLNGSNLNSSHWDINLELQTVPVPEPESILLLGIGLLALGLLGRKFILAKA